VNCCRYSGASFQNYARDVRPLIEDVNFSDIPFLSGLDRVNLARLIAAFEMEQGG
jgi:hypothetical protein